MTKQVNVTHTVWVTGRDKDGTVLSRTGGYTVPENWELSDPALLNAKAHRDEMQAKWGDEHDMTYVVEVCVETVTVDTHYYVIDVPNGGQ